MPTSEIQLQIRATVRTNERTNVVRGFMWGGALETMIEKRVAGLRDMMKKAGSRDAELPYVLIENSDRCQRNSSREKVLGNGTVWVPAFFETVAQVAQSFPAAYKYNPKMVNRRAQFIAKFIYIPCILLFQVVGLGRFSFCGA